MSNEDKKKIADYMKRRMKFIFVQLGIITSLTIVFIALFMIYRSVDNQYYVSYSETSSIDYKVNLKNNDLYEEDYLGEDYAYVTALIDNIDAIYNYKINIDANNVKYNFSYKAIAALQVIDTTTNIAIYKPVYEIVDEVKGEYNSKEINVSVPLKIDFNKYNEEALNFIKKLNLSSTKANLKVTVIFNVESNCEDFEDQDNIHELTLDVPLNKSVIKITESQSIPTTSKNIACEKVVEKSNIFLMAISVLAVDVLAIIILILYTYFTRNTHINYANKVKRIVNAYKSFIHEIKNSFDTAGYQVLYVKTIREMLEIRDTIQSPILMNENDDKTLTQFIIPTSNNILYIHEIKIDNYDEIYGINEEPIEEVVQEPVLESQVFEETFDKKDAEDIVTEEKSQSEGQLTARKTAVNNAKNNLKQVNNHGPKIVIDNKGEYLLNVSIKTPDEHSVFKTNDKKKEIVINQKNKTNKK